MRFRLYSTFFMCLVALFIFCGSQGENGPADADNNWELEGSRIILSKTMQTRLETDKEGILRKEIEECVNKIFILNADIEKFFKDTEFDKIAKILKRTVICSPEGKIISGYEDHLRFWKDSYDKAIKKAGPNGTVTLHIKVTNFNFREDIDYKARFKDDKEYKDKTINFSGDVHFQYKIISEQAEKIVQNAGGRGWGECCHQTGCDCDFCGPGGQ